MPRARADSMPQGAKASPRTRSPKARSRSTTSTRAPRAAIAVASEAPPRPPPTVTMSYVGSPTRARASTVRAVKSTRLLTTGEPEDAERAFGGPLVAAVARPLPLDPGPDGFALVVGDERRVDGDARAVHAHG